MQQHHHSRRRKGERNENYAETGILLISTETDPEQIRARSGQDPGKLQGLASGH